MSISDFSVARCSTARRIIAISPSSRLNARVAGSESETTLRRNRLAIDQVARSEEHTSELQSLMRNSYAVFCLKKKRKKKTHIHKQKKLSANVKENSSIH